jgi:hypothetical protein
LKDFSASISYSPTVEAYLAQAEVLFTIGQPRQALEKIKWVENRIPLLPNCDELEEQVAQLKAKLSKHSPTSNSGVATTRELRLIIPVKAAATKDIYLRLTEPSSLNSTDGITLINKSTKSVVYSLSVANRERHSVEMMLSSGQGRLPFNHIRAIKEHTHLIHLSGPNPNYTSRVETQLDLASDIMQTGAILAQELESVAVYVATAGMTHTIESFGNLNAIHDLPSLLSAFVQRVGSSGFFYTCGMHALGYADVRLEADLSPQDATRIMNEFLEFSLFKDLRDDVARFPFKSHTSLKEYDVQLSECPYFDKRDPFYNEHGVWTLRPLH